PDLDVVEIDRGGEALGEGWRQYGAGGQRVGLFGLEVRVARLDLADLHRSSEHWIEHVGVRASAIFEQLGDVGRADVAGAGGAKAEAVERDVGSAGLPGIDGAAQRIMGATDRA